MPLLGSGIVPSGAVGTELSAVTRRAFIPKLVVQLYKATPVLSAALSNAQTASGGVSSVTVPVQGTALTQAQATDFTGTFNSPGQVTGITEADFNLKAVVVPIPFLGMEGLVQLNAAVVPLIEARMNDAGNQVADYLSTQLFTNGTPGTINIDGFPLMTDNTQTYGNIANRSSTGVNSWWGSNARTETAAITRNTVLADIVSAFKFAGGEMPNMGVLGPSSWTALAQNFASLEQYRITPGESFDQSNLGARSMFTALMVAGVPIYLEPNYPDNQILLLNTRYFSFYIHEAAAFAFTGFASTLPNFQLGYIGALVAVLEAICVKPSTITQGKSYTAATPV